MSYSRDYCREERLYPDIDPELKKKLSYTKELAPTKPAQGKRASAAPGASESGNDITIKLSPETFRELFSKLAPSELQLLLNNVNLPGTTVRDEKVQLAPIQSKNGTGGHISNLTDPAPLEEKVLVTPVPTPANPSGQVEDAIAQVQLKLPSVPSSESLVLRRELQQLAGSSNPWNDIIMCPTLHAAYQKLDPKKRSFIDTALAGLVSISDPKVQDQIIAVL